MLGIHVYIYIYMGRLGRSGWNTLHYTPPVVHLASLGGRSVGVKIGGVNFV